MCICSMCIVHPREITNEDSFQLSSAFDFVYLPTTNSALCFLGERNESSLIHSMASAGEEI